MTTSNFFKKKRLTIVGAGPKGLAVALRAHVYKELGFDIPEICIIEKNEIAAHWTGRHGFTNGQLSLGTSPEKDLGFPYENDGTEISKKVSERLQNFSWKAYQISQGRYSDWVDRGSPQPTHEQWGAYLKFVANEIAGSVTFINAEVLKVRRELKGWALELQEKDSSVTHFSTDALMITGPAIPKMPACFPSDRIFNMANVWEKIAELEHGASKQALRIAVVGNGETAASVLLALSRRKFPNFRVEVIAPQGVIHTRGESFLENKFYSASHQTQWKQMSRADRKAFVRRTDIGVFSPGALNELRNEDIVIVPGRAITATNHEGHQVALELEYNLQKETRIYDYVFFASGLNHSKLLEKLFGAKELNEIIYTSGADSLEHSIESDLSVRGLASKLYLPMLAGLEQGPGFANLSCLGLLASRVLDPLVSLKKYKESYEKVYEATYRLHSA